MDGDEAKREVLELTYSEVSTRLDDRQEELQNHRESALRTLRASVLFIGIIVTFSSQFRGFLAAFAAREFVWTWTNVVGGLMISASGIILLGSPLFALLSLYNGHISSTIDPMDMSRLSDGRVVTMTTEGRVNLLKSPDEWYRYMIKEHSNTLREYDSVLQNTRRYLKWSHLCFYIGPIAFLLGIWLDVVQL